MRNVHILTNSANFPNLQRNKNLLMGEKITHLKKKKKSPVRKIYISTICCKKSQIMLIVNEITCLWKKKNRAFKRYQPREKFIF